VHPSSCCENFVGQAAGVQCARCWQTEKGELLANQAQANEVWSDIELAPADVVQVEERFRLSVAALIDAGLRPIEPILPGKTRGGPTKEWARRETMFWR